MLAKRLAVLAAALAVSAPALADRGHHRGHRHVVKHYYHVKPKPVVQHYYHPHYIHYHPAPRPVVVYHQPVYPGAALLVGAVIGAAIAHQATTGSYMAGTYTSY